MRTDLEIAEHPSKQAGWGARWVSLTTHARASNEYETQLAVHEHILQHLQHPALELVGLSRAVCVWIQSECVLPFRRPRVVSGTLHSQTLVFRGFLICLRFTLARVSHMYKVDVRPI